MRLMLFPAAIMANTFAMMLVMIGLSLFGKPGLAADFGLIHGATVALFYSFSGNARSLILSESREIDTAGILRLRLLMLLPLGILSLILCIGLVSVGWLFLLLLVVRRAAEWLAEVFVSDLELRHQGIAALRFLLIQACLCLVLLLALLEGGPLATPITLLWALSPLLGCMNLTLLRRALAKTVPVFSIIRLLLPHFGSTAVIGVSVYLFRLFILLVAGKEVAGDLFSAFALGGILGAVFSQALGPSMVRQERYGLSSGRLPRMLTLMLGVVLLGGLALVASVWTNSHLLDWTQKNQLFWLAVGCSLVGGVVMVLAQRIRLRILQHGVGGDVFGSDMLANILLIAAIPFLFYWIGAQALAVLYLFGAIISLAFYASEKRGLLQMPIIRRISEARILFLLSVLLMAPIFFQLKGGLFTSKEFYLTSGGSLSWLPLPFSILTCYFGVLLLGGYSRVRLALLMVFLIFLGILFSCLFAGELNGGKLILLVQYILPILGLVLGQQFARREQALNLVAKAAAMILSIVVPLQLISTWQLGYSLLSPSAVIFSLYQHLQYVPVIFVGLFWLAVFSLERRRSANAWVVGMGFLMGWYVVLSYSMLAMAFMLLAGLGFAVRIGCQRRFGLVISLMVVASAGAFLGYSQVSGTELFAQKFSTQKFFVQDTQAPINILERTEYWKFYTGQILDNGKELVLGHAMPPDRRLYPSAHNYYLDLIFNFGLVGACALLGLLVYTVILVLRSFSFIWSQPALLGLVGVVAFFLLVDNLLKVGLRQPYSGILMFFLWGLLLGLLPRRAVQAEV